MTGARHAARWLLALAMAPGCAGGRVPAPAPPTTDEVFARAAAAPPGAYPRWASHRQTYWTVVGVDADATEALVDEDGMVEIVPGAVSLQPFVEVGDGLVTWADVETAQALAEGSLPVPTVEWRHAAFTLSVTAFTTGTPGAAVLRMRYRLTPRAGAPAPRRLWLALRPLQVLPPWQDLNVTGGAGRLPALAETPRGVRLGERTLVAAPIPARFEPLPLEAPPLGSRALGFDVGGETLVVDLAVPLGDGTPPAPPLSHDAAAAHAEVTEMLAAATAAWAARTAPPAITLPSAHRDLVGVAQSTIGYVLVNRDGPAIRPGSRNYQRSWIRDGALTASMLLAFGHPAPAREFLDWYAPYQFPDGKVPCCVDARGADPTPEYDSDGELIHAVAEYWSFTRDRAALERLWPHVARAAAHIESLRAERSGTAWRGRAAEGLVPESISHEGYHKHPVHSYWDDFFALRGLGAAAELARATGEHAAAERLAREHADFARAIGRSIAQTMARHGIDYVPGSVELGDFDPTSTAIAVTVADAADLAPPGALLRTFERYHDEIVRWRRDGPQREGFTPYEARNADALVRLGRREDAWDVLRFVLGGRRPSAWNEWGEVVWSDPRAPRFIGDMPHTWAASAVVEALRTMLVYERGRDGALVLAAGIPASWLAGGEPVAVAGMPTHAGPLSYRLERRSSGEVVMTVAAGGLRLPPAGLVLSPPGVSGRSRVRVDDRAATPATDGSIVVHVLPVRVIWTVA